MHIAVQPREVVAPRAEILRGHLLTTGGLSAAAAGKIDQLVRRHLDAALHSRGGAYDKLEPRLAVKRESKTKWQPAKAELADLEKLYSHYKVGRILLMVPASPVAQWCIRH